MGKEALKKLLAANHVFVSTNKGASAKSHGNLNAAKYKRWGTSSQK